MKTHFPAWVLAVVTVAISCHSASAGFIGMPLHLKAAIDLNELDFQANSCQFYTDDVFTGPVLVKGC